MKVVPPPSRPKPSPTRGRGPLVAAAIALALVVLVMSVLLIVLRDDDEPGGNQAAPNPSPTVPTTGAPATSAAGSTAGAGDPTGNPTGEATGEPAQPTAAPPSNPTGPGTTKRPVPSSWSIVRRVLGLPGTGAARHEGQPRKHPRAYDSAAAGGCSSSTSGTTRSPTRWPTGSARSRYRVERGDWAEYDRIQIVAVDYFQKAADWEWTYTGNSGTRIHVLNRGFITGPKQAHSIYWSTPESRWAASLSDLQIILDNFVPNPA